MSLSLYQAILPFWYHVGKFLRMKWSRDHVLTSDLNAGTWGLWHGFMTNVVLDD
jgi:hypothetical protein